jgi:hypothetical protein
MKKTILIIALVLMPSLSLAQNLGRFQNWCQYGGQQVILQGLQSTTLVQASFPQCQVTVYATGTTNKATIYSDNLSTPTPLANPFTANIDGSFGFYSLTSSIYDVTISGAGLPAPFTFSAVTLPALGGGGGGGGLSGSGTAGLVPLWTAPTTLGNSGLADDLGGNLTYQGATVNLTTNLVGGSARLSAANGSGSTPGGAVIIDAGSTVGSGHGGGITLNAGSSPSSSLGNNNNISFNSGSVTTGQAGSVFVNGGGSTSGSGSGGHVFLVPGLGPGSPSNNGVVVVGSSNGSQISPLSFFFGDVAFGSLPTPQNNPSRVTAANKGALLYCLTCLGAQDAVSVGTVAVGGGTGSLVMWDGTAWRTVSGLGTGGGGGGGSVTQLNPGSGAGTLSPLFTFGFSNQTTTPVLAFSLSTAGAHKFLGNNTGSTAAPGYQSIGTGDLPFTYSGNTAELATVATLSGTSSPICTDASGNMTTSSCPAGNVTTTPAAGASQIIAQQAGTKFAVNNLDGAKYADRYNWSQALPSSVSIGANTLILTPCPNGFNAATDVLDYVYLSSGTPEADLVTGGTCTSGAASGTVTFTATGTHTTGTIGSASGGIKEAVNDAAFAPTNPTDSKQSGLVVVPPGYEANAYGPVYTPVTNITVDFTGSIVNCFVTSGPCLVAGDNVAYGTSGYQDITFLYPRMRANAASTGVAIEDNSHNGGRFIGMTTRQQLSGAYFGGGFFQGDNDQSLLVDGIDLSLGGWAPTCTAARCPPVLYFPNNGGNYAVGWIKHWNGTLQCQSNGLWSNQGNGIHVTDSVIQGYPEYALSVLGAYSNNPSIDADFNYNEVGNCNNPMYAAGNQKAQMGLSSQTGKATFSGVGPVGQIPAFAVSAAGSTVTSIYVVTHSSTYGPSVEMLAGTCSTNGTGTCTVQWPEIGTAGTITYDLIGQGQISGANIPPVNTGNFAYATAVTTSSCTAGYPSGMCTSTITMGSPSSYTVPRVTYYPNVPFWPADIVLSSNSDTSSFTNPSQFYTPMLDVQGGIMSVLGGNWPSVHTLSTGFPISLNNLVWVQYGGSDSDTAYIGGNALVLPSGQASAAPNTTGVFGTVPSGDAGFDAQYATELITLGYTDVNSLFASTTHRMAASATDTYIGLDQASAQGPANYQLRLEAPIAISSGIGVVGSNTNWLERLTATAKTINVNTTVNGNFTVTGTCTGCGVVSFPGAGIPVSTGSAWGTSLSETDGDIIYGASSAWTKGTALPNGITATTQSGGDNSTKVATTAYADTMGALKLNVANSAPTGTFNGSGLTQMKLPVGAGFATLANGEVGYDSTNKNWHVWQNGADVLLVPLAAGFVSGNCGQPTATGSTWVDADAGSPCGAAAGAPYPAGSGIPIVVAGTSWGTTLTETDGNMLAGVSGAWAKVTALPNGITATTQTLLSGDTKVATDNYVDQHFIASGSTALGTSSIASATCATTVTASATGTLTTDVVRAGFNSDPTATTGYVPSTSGMLTIIAYPTAGVVSFKVCNNTSASITPGAISVNWQVVR